MSPLLQHPSPSPLSPPAPSRPSRPDGDPLPLELIGYGENYRIRHDGLSFRGKGRVAGRKRLSTAPGSTLPRPNLINVLTNPTSTLISNPRSNNPTSMSISSPVLISSTYQSPNLNLLPGRLDEDGSPLLLSPPTFGMGTGIGMERSKSSSPAQTGGRFRGLEQLGGEKAYQKEMRVGKGGSPWMSTAAGGYDHDYDQGRKENHQQHQYQQQQHELDNPPHPSPSSPFLPNPNPNRLTLTPNHRHRHSIELSTQHISHQLESQHSSNRLSGRFGFPPKAGKVLGIGASHGAEGGSKGLGEWRIRRKPVPRLGSREGREVVVLETGMGMGIRGVDGIGEATQASRDYLALSPEEARSTINTIPSPNFTIASSSSSRSTATRRSPTPVPTSKAKEIAKIHAKLLQQTQPPPQPTPTKTKPPHHRRSETFNGRIHATNPLYSPSPLVLSSPHFKQAPAAFMGNGSEAGRKGVDGWDRSRGIYGVGDGEGYREGFYAKGGYLVVQHSTPGEERSADVGKDLGRGGVEAVISQHVKSNGSSQGEEDGRTSGFGTAASVSGSMNTLIPSSSSMSLSSTQVRTPWMSPSSSAVGMGRTIGMGIVGDEHAEMGMMSHGKAAEGRSRMREVSIEDMMLGGHNSPHIGSPIPDLEEDNFATLRGGWNPYFAAGQHSHSNKIRQARSPLFQPGGQPYSMTTHSRSGTQDELDTVGTITPGVQRRKGFENGYFPSPLTEVPPTFKTPPEDGMEEGSDVQEEMAEVMIPGRAPMVMPVEVSLHQPMITPALLRSGKYKIQLPPIPIPSPASPPRSPTALDKLTPVSQWSWAESEISRQGSSFSTEGAKTTSSDDSFAALRRDSSEFDFYAGPPGSIPRPVLGQRKASAMNQVSRPEDNESTTQDEAGAEIEIKVDEVDLLMDEARGAFDEHQAEPSMERRLSASMYSEYESDLGSSTIMPAKSSSSSSSGRRAQGEIVALDIPSYPLNADEDERRASRSGYWDYPIVRGGMTTPPPPDFFSAANRVKSPRSNFGSPVSVTHSVKLGSKRELEIPPSPGFNASLAQAQAFQNPAAWSPNTCPPMSQGPPQSVHNAASPPRKQRMYDASRLLRTPNSEPARSPLSRSPTRQSRPGSRARQDDDPEQGAGLLNQAQAMGRSSPEPQLRLERLPGRSSEPVRSRSVAESPSPKNKQGISSPSMSGIARAVGSGIASLSSYAAWKTSPQRGSNNQSIRESGSTTSYKTPMSRPGTRDGEKHASKSTMMSPVDSFDQLEIGMLPEDAVGPSSEMQRNVSRFRNAPPVFHFPSPPPSDRHNSMLSMLSSNAQDLGKRFSSFSLLSNDEHRIKAAGYEHRSPKRQIPLTKETLRALDEQFMSDSPATTPPMKAPTTPQQHSRENRRSTNSLEEEPAIFGSTSPRNHKSPRMARSPNYATPTQQMTSRFTPQSDQAFLHSHSPPAINVESADRDPYLVHYRSAVPHVSPQRLPTTAARSTFAPRSSPLFGESPQSSPRYHAVQSPLIVNRGHHPPAIQVETAEARLRPLQQMTDDGSASAHSQTSFIAMEMRRGSMMESELSERYLPAPRQWRDVYCACFGRQIC